MARALIAAARARRLPESGSTAQAPIGGSTLALLAVVTGLPLALLGVLLSFTGGPTDMPPALSELSHRTRRVERVGTAVRHVGSIELALANDDFAFYVVRGEARAEAVRSAVRVGDEIEIWHDRSERTFGPIGAIFQLRTPAGLVVDRDAYAAEQVRNARHPLPWSLPLAAMGALIWARGMSAQMRKAVVRIAG
jgi:hypothetical protein